MKNGGKLKSNFYKHVKDNVMKSLLPLPLQPSFQSALATISKNTTKYFKGKDKDDDSDKKGGSKKKKKGGKKGGSVVYGDKSANLGAYVV